MFGPCFVMFWCPFLFCNHLHELLCVIFSNTIKSVLSGHSKMDKTKILLTNSSLMKVERMLPLCVMWFFLTVPWVGLQCVIVVFPDHTHSPFVFVNKIKIHVCMYLDKNSA